MSVTAHPDNLAAIRYARAYLLRVAEPPAPALSAFVDAHGPRPAAELVRVQNVPDAVRRETSPRHQFDHVDADFAAAADAEARLVIPEDDEWPTHLFAALARTATRGADWATPPIALWTQSAKPLRTALDRSVAVVGARAATSYGHEVAADFAFNLAMDEMGVTTGGSFGIDLEAHRGVIFGKGMATAVLSTGIDVLYPVANNILRDVRTEGVLLSEYPPGTQPARHRFLARNRLIAAVTVGTVVVEAGPRSGALNIARVAGSLGRPVMAVPGPITSAMSVGCHELLRSRIAVPVTSVDDIQDALNAVGRRTA